MGTYILRRILYVIPVLLAVSLLSFIIIQLPPGDYLTAKIAQLQLDRGSYTSQAEAAVSFSTICPGDASGLISSAKALWSSVAESLKLTSLSLLRRPSSALRAGAIMFISRFCSLTVMVPVAPRFRLIVFVVALNDGCTQLGKGRDSLLGCFVCLIEIT